MKHVMINSQEYRIPTKEDGSISEAEIRRIGGIPRNRTLILKDSDGSNKVLNRNQNIFIKPGQHIGDISDNTRGE